MTDGRWVAAITLEGRKRKVFYGKTRKEAQEKLKKALHEQQKGTLITSPQQTMEQFLTQWLDTHKKSVRIRTSERYEEYVRLHIIPVIGHVKLQKLTAQHVDALYAKKLDEGLSPTTVNTLHGVLHKALEDAMRWELIAKNVCDMVTPPRRAHYEITSLTMEQAQKLLVTAKGHNMEALFVLAITTGMRRGEVLALKWQDINFSQNQLQVRRIFTRAPGNRYIEAEPKTTKSRRNIMLAPMVVELLKQHHIRQLEAKKEAGTDWQERDLVFCTSLGTPLNPNKVIERFKTLLKRAELPDIRFHDLRHSAASILLSMDVHPKVVQELLGHNQISMTMDIYSHVLPTMQKDAMSKLNDALRGQEEDEGDAGNDDDGMAGARVPVAPRR
jgi:integrase